METSAQAFQNRTFSIKLWPPSLNTRQLLVERMTKNLSAESIFSRKYGLLSEEEANENARKIEETCFAVANDYFEKEKDGDGSSAVQLYAKESSKMMLDVLKRGPSPKPDVQAAVVESQPHVTVLDLSGRRRAFIDAEEAKELLGPLTIKGNSYTKIILSNHSFGLDAACVAGPILESLKNQLTDVDLSDFIAGRSEEEALDVMRIFSSALEGAVLRYLNLSNNALGEKGIRAFEALLKSQHNLEELYLMNDGISEEAAKAVSELIPSTYNLRVLHFHNNMTGDEGAIAISEILKHSPVLEDFRCSSTRVDSAGGIAIAEALISCTGLKKLDLRDNMFGVKAGLALSKTLQLLPGLVELYLSYLNLEDEGATAIFVSLKVSAPSLEVLEMAGNEITAKSIPSLVECIVSKQTLTKLNLAENELKDEGAILIGQALKESHPCLKELDLSTNIIRRAGARTLAHAVGSNKPSFSLLNLNGNAISDEGIDEVRGILKALRGSDDAFGPLDENDEANGEEGEENEGEDGEGKEEAEDVTGAADGEVVEEKEEELEAKLKGLAVNEETN